MLRRHGGRRRWVLGEPYARRSRAPSCENVLAEAMKKPCNYPGCAALLTSGRYCEAHAKQSPAHKARERFEERRANDPDLSEAKRIRSTQAWRKARKAKLGIDPLCEDPFGEHAKFGATVPAQEVHHVEGLTQAPEKALDLCNLQSLCRRCHARIEWGIRNEKMNRMKR